MVMDLKHQHWWYNLAHVCQQWRNIILESSSWLDIHLLCTNGVPVEDMLVNSPPLPLTIYYPTCEGITMAAKDELGIFLALLHCDCVHHIHLSKLVHVGRFVNVMNGQFPILEHMYIHSYAWTKVVLPVTFRAPNLHHLKLEQVCIPIRPPILTTAAELVSLTLLKIPDFTDFTPTYLLTQLSLMPQLEKLGIGFRPIPSRDVAMQLHQSQNITQVTLPNVHLLVYQGPDIYLDGLSARITAPSLSTLAVCIYCHYPLQVDVPSFLQFMQTSENLRFSATKITFKGFHTSVVAVGAESRNNPPFQLHIKGTESYRSWLPHIVLQTSMQALCALSPVFSTMEQVTLAHQEHKKVPGWITRFEDRQWIKLLGLFTNVRTIHVQDDLVGEFTHFLRLHDGEPPLEFLPNLEEFGYSGGLNVWDAHDLNRFVNARREAGHLMSLRVVDRSMFFDDSESHSDSFQDSDSD
jgi:hypothetical protein